MWRRLIIISIFANVEYEVIISLGSNSDQTICIEKSKSMLKSVFPRMVFTTLISTEPIGKPDDPIVVRGENFANCLGSAYTDLDIKNVLDLLKKIERDCGNTITLRNNGIVKMDLDLMQFGYKRKHTRNWQLPFMKQQITQLRKTQAKLKNGGIELLKKQRH